MKETPKIRSWLIVEPSADVAAAGAVGADRIVLDLTGPSESWAAVEGGCNAWAKVEPDNPPAFLLPPFISGRTEAAAEQAIRFGASTILLAGVRSGAEVQRLDVLLRVEELFGNRPVGSAAIVALADVAGILAASSFERCSGRLTGLGWEAGFDPATDTARLVRATIGLAAAAAGISAIDTVSPTGDEGIFREECRIARESGFAGKLSRTFRQIPIINHIFAD